MVMCFTWCTGMRFAPIGKKDLIRYRPPKKTASEIMCVNTYKD